MLSVTLSKEKRHFHLHRSVMLHQLCKYINVSKQSSVFFSQKIKMDMNHRTAAGKRNKLLKLTAYEMFTDKMTEILEPIVTSTHDIHLNSLDRITRIPVVGSTIQTATTVYVKVKVLTNL